MCVGDSRIVWIVEACWKRRGGEEEEADDLLRLTASN